MENKQSAAATSSSVSEGSYVLAGTSPAASSPAAKSLAFQR